MAIEVDYRFSLGIDAERQAKVIAVGQTVGTWDARFAHSEDFLRYDFFDVRDRLTQMWLKQF